MSVQREINLLRAVADAAQVVVWPGWTKPSEILAKVRLAELSKVLGELRAWEYESGAVGGSRLQALDFAYGNLSASTNHKPTLAAFRSISTHLGVPANVFDRWAAGKEWREECCAEGCHFGD